jgi:adenosylcobinamide-phosphate synthase
LEKLLEKLRAFNSWGGLVLLLATQTAVVGFYLIFNSVMAGYALVLAIFVVYSSLSVQDLIKHGRAVMIALERGDLSQARNAVQMMIGRDAKVLDEHGVARAAVESLAENFVDGFLAPLFWFTIGALLADKIGLEPEILGCALILIYKTTNTLDSMVGYKNEKYLKFGKTSAQLDDILNVVPARMSIPIIAFSALICSLDGWQALLVGWKDRLKHSSPNAGHAEAAMAGALHIQLNGPGIYPHGKVDKPWLGEGTRYVTATHLKQSSYLVLTAAFVSTVLCLVALTMN